MNRHALHLGILGLLGLLFAAIGAEAGTISKVPIRITKPGKYSLKANVTPPATATSPDNAAIVIDADNVELDLQGFTVAGNPDNTTVDTGILILGKKGIRVRNGRIRDFPFGLNAGNATFDLLCEGLEIRAAATATQPAPIVARSVAKGSHFRNCTFVLDSLTGTALALSSSGGGPAHIVEFCTFYAITLGAANQNGVIAGGAPATVVRNSQFLNLVLGISGNNNTTAADNVFQNCTTKLDGAVTNPAGYNQ
jgi:hypothetical protein